MGRRWKRTQAWTFCRVDEIVRREQRRWGIHGSVHKLGHDVALMGRRWDCPKGHEISGHSSLGIDYQCINSLTIEGIFQ